MKTQAGGKSMGMTGKAGFLPGPLHELSYLGFDSFQGANYL